MTLPIRNANPKSNSTPKSEGMVCMIGRPTVSKGLRWGGGGLCLEKRLHDRLVPVRLPANNVD